jgi:hypothetical protein
MHNILTGNFTRGYIESQYYNFIVPEGLRGLGFNQIPDELVIELTNNHPEASCKYGDIHLGGQGG